MAVATLDKLFSESSVPVWWNRLLDKTGDDPFTLFVCGTFLLNCFYYWLFGGFFSLVDFTKRPRWMLKYKVEPDQNIPLENAKYWKAVKQVHINLLVVSPIVICITYALAFETLTPADVRQLPPLSTFVSHIAIMTLGEELMYYYTHRLLHHPSLYKYIHKKHHEWKSPTAFTTFYCHPVEHALSNIGPILLSTALLKAHISTLWLFILIAHTKSVADHSRYLLPIPFYHASVLHHDLHHAKSNCNYGVLGLLDIMHGTFRRTYHKKT